MCDPDIIHIDLLHISEDLSSFAGQPAVYHKGYAEEYKAD